MKLIAFAGVIILLSSMTMNLTSCGDKPTPLGSWDKQSSDFEGISRAYAVSFVIGDSAYVGTGFSYDSGKLSDIWKYDPSSDSWSKKAKFPGDARSQAVAFSLNGKGYIGTGIDKDGNYLNDFYEFDPTSNSEGTWRRIADFPSARIGSLAFVVKGKAFVGSGRDSGGDLKDLWQYDQANNTWVAQSSMGGSKRENAFVMVINDIAYVGGGTDNGQYVTDFYKFDISQNGGLGTWTALNGLTGKDVNGNAIVQPRPRESASTFASGNFGYITCGSTNGPLNDTWQYNPSNDSWTQYFSIGINIPIAGAPREGAVSFVLKTSTGTLGYLTTGQYSGSSDLNDFWNFNPLGSEPDYK